MKGSQGKGATPLHLLLAYSNTPFLALCQLLTPATFPKCIFFLLSSGLGSLTQEGHKLETDQDPK